ncbi:hypothetical protein GCM10027275_07190 [Rhabdobacter roseus]|uniref:Uncharacterized protein n=1 Tax=Rhabdobacter roseus TaxID=1655419 RepID=A0A840TES0_9BACT|nr:hypothetical protein [Rhabdobacter roseus]MBB5282616.1 hypothetical protein [Rhabdobacter roseus]
MTPSNFSFLEAEYPILFNIGQSAEYHLHTDPASSLMKQRLFAERLTIKPLKEKVDKLPQALLAKAFRGELVPQDSTDEPARVLLERIKALKQEKSTPAPKPARKKTAATGTLPKGVLARPAEKPLPVYAQPEEEAWVVQEEGTQLAMHFGENKL